MSVRPDSSKILALYKSHAYLQSTDSFSRDVKTFLFHSVYGHQDTD